MTTETKMLIGTGIGTIALIGGLAWFSSYSSTDTTEAVDAAKLVTADSYTVPANNNKVTLVEFGDFQCPACGAMHPVVKQLMNDYQGKVTFVWRNFPLPQHAHAALAAQVALAAGEQGKFWEMHDKLFETQGVWGNVSTNQQALDMFLQYAKELSLNSDQVKQAIESEKFTDSIQRDKNDGNAVGVNSTPTFFLNGKKLSPTANYTQLKQLIDQELQK